MGNNRPQSFAKKRSADKRTKIKEAADYSEITSNAEYSVVNRKSKLDVSEVDI